MFILKRTAFVILASLLIGTLWTVSAHSQEAPPVEAYGDLPAVRNMTISPDGQHLAFIKREQGRDLLTVAKVGGGILGAVEVKDFEARGVDWAGKKHAILLGTDMTYDDRIGEFRFAGAIAYNIESKKTAQLLSRGRDLAPKASSGTTISHIFEGEGKVLMPATQKSGSRAMFRVNLDNGSGTKVYNLSDKRVLLDDAGNIAFEIDRDDTRNFYEVKRRVGDSFEVIWREDNVKEDDWDITYPKVRVIGYNHDASRLLVWYDEERNAYSIPTIKAMTFSGEIEDAGFENPYEAEQIAGTIQNGKGNIIGLQYEGITPLYEFFDEALQQTVWSAQAAFPDSAVRVASASDDFSKIVFNVSGGGAAGDYYLLDRTRGSLSPIGSSRPNISKDQIGFVEIIEYEARDGLRIPALLTWPAGVEPGTGKDLPLVVLPHGGPEAHDELSFDWMAQMPASRGMLVIQPQFRGSDGFGREFRDMGRGRWGKEMQDDVTDAAEFLIEQGYADPDRVCIFGWSYGGYAALAGAAFTPDLYKCVVAGAGVSDLPGMLFWEGRETGFQSPVVAYWNRVIGDRREDRDKLKNISPANFADKVSAPVLLIHGDDDDVVPIEQSETMMKALQRAGKPVEMIELKDEDHWMSTGEGRMKTATAVEKFLTEHLIEN